VQGPIGLTGPEGPIGASGRDGQPGNTIHTVQGAPDGSLGRDGDYAINVVVWEIYGPRSGGAWGTGTPLRGNTRGGQNTNTTQTLFGSNSSGGSSGGGGVAQTTRTLPLSNPTRSARKLPSTEGLKTQADYNEWTFNSLESLANGVSPELDLSDYAKQEYVDNADDALSARIQSVEQDYTTSAEFSSVTQQVTKNKNDIKTLQEAPAPEPPNLSGYATKQDLSTATSALPYRLETDKVTRAADQAPKQNFAGGDVAPAHVGGEIQLVDNLGYFHNIRFNGVNGIATSSDQQGIIVDGSALQGRIQTLEEQLALLSTLIPPVDYGEITITGGNGYHDNQCWLAPDETGLFICNLSGSNTHGCRYEWELMRGTARFSGPTNESTVMLINQSPAPNTVVIRCTVSHPTTDELVHGEINILIQNPD